MKPAIFLDRDGVINVNRHNYVQHWGEFVFLEPAVEALIKIADTPYPIIVVTNQSGVERGYFTAEAAQDVNDRMIAALADRGARVDHAYFCPHDPKSMCNCRKPEPGMLEQGSADFDIDLSRSIMVGDALTDIEAGRNAGVAGTALVLTGRGEAQLALPHASSLDPLNVVADLAAALKLLMPLLAQ